MFSMDKSAKSLPTGEKKKKKRDGKYVKIENLRNWSTYEYIVYNLDVLVPEDEAEEMFVPTGSYLQKVSFRDKQKWRVLKNNQKELPEYLTDHKEPESTYDVYKEKKQFIPIFDLTSPFLRKWDMLGLVLLLFTASVTPFETAFITGTITIDVLFLINRAVDSVFMFDMFVQARTPYKDAKTGKLIRNPSLIARNYISGWAPIDLISVIPFELLGFLQSGETNVSQLSILRVLRLTKLAKLLRIFRASRKMKQMQVYINLRYSTLQLVKYLIMIIFIIHWLACGFRIATERTDVVNEEAGWIDTLATSKNQSLDDMNMLSVYLTTLYMSSGTVGLMGYASQYVQPTAYREYGYQFFANFVSYFMAIYLIASLTDTLAMAGRISTQQDLLVDNYLEMFDKLKLDIRLKLKVNEYLGSHFAQSAQAKETEMMKKLPVSLHGFISMEIFMEFILSIPFLEPFVEREPSLTQALCRGVEVRSFSANTLLFAEGMEGIYYLEHGIVSVEGRIYVSGSIFGLTVLREKVKKNECRCLTGVDIHILPKSVLLEALEEYPKIKYYIKRWTAWELLREYVIAYKDLYYTAARRGALMDPPLVSSRPNMSEGEFDDIDIAVLEHMNEAGY